jgi:nucleolar protein 15
MLTFSFFYFCLGPEWESSDEEENAALVETKKTTKEKNSDKKKKQKDGTVKLVDNNDGDDNEIEAEKDATVIYIGHIPPEFEERDLRMFLSQFGKVERCRISRNVKTGHPRGYAFCKFTDAETATIVAETLQGYFLGKRRLVAHLVPNANRSMFFNTDTVIARRELNKKVHQKQRQRNLTSVTKMKEITARLVSREKKKRSKMAALGIDYDFPGYQADSVKEESSPKKKQRKESMDDKTSEADDADNKSKTKTRKDSISSDTSAKKSKGKDSVGSPATPSKRKSKRIQNNLETTPSKKEESEAKVVQSEKKKKKAKNNRRVSAP